MATAYSQPLQYTPYQEQWNKELLMKALQYKQEKYDFGRERIKGAMSDILQIDLIKDQDAEYLYDRLQSVVNIFNTQGMGDLSIDSRTDYLTGYLAQVADQKVLNGYLGTKTIRDIQEEAEASKEDGQFNETNLSYSLRDAMEWVNDGQIGSALSPNAQDYYSKYVDKFDVLSEIAKEMEPESIVIFDPVEGTEGLTWFSQDGDTLSADRLISAFNLKVESSPDLAEQFKVDAWASNYGITDEQFVLDTREAYQENIDYYKDVINDLKNAKATTADTEEKEAYDQQIELATSYIQEYETVMNYSDDELINRRERINYLDYKTDYLQALAGTLAYTQMNKPSLEVDGGRQFLKAEAGRNSRHNADMAYKYTKLDYDMNKDLAKIIEKYNKAETEDEKEEVLEAYSSILDRRGEEGIPTTTAGRRFLLKPGAVGDSPDDYYDLTTAEGRNQFNTDQITTDPGAVGAVRTSEIPREISNLSVSDMEKFVKDQRVQETELLSELLDANFVPSEADRIKGELESGRMDYTDVYTMFEAENYNNNTDVLSGTDKEARRVGAHRILAQAEEFGLTADMANNALLEARADRDGILDALVSDAFYGEGAFENNIELNFVDKEYKKVDGTYDTYYDVDTDKQFSRQGLIEELAYQIDSYRGSGETLKNNDIQIDRVDWLPGFTDNYGTQLAQNLNNIGTQFEDMFLQPRTGSKYTIDLNTDDGRIIMEDFADRYGPLIYTDAYNVNALAPKSVDTDKLAPVSAFMEVATDIKGVLANTKKGASDKETTESYDRPTLIANATMEYLPGSGIEGGDIFKVSLGTVATGKNAGKDLTVYLPAGDAMTEGVSGKLLNQLRTTSDVQERANMTDDVIFGTMQENRSTVYESKSGFSPGLLEDKYFNGKEGMPLLQTSLNFNLVYNRRPSGSKYITIEGKAKRYALVGNNFQSVDLENSQGTPLGDNTFHVPAFKGQEFKSSAEALKALEETFSDEYRTLEIYYEALESPNGLNKQHPTFTVKNPDGTTTQHIIPEEEEE